MKNLSSFIVLAVALCFSATIFAQTPPVIPPVSSGTLESLGFDSGEIDAILGTSTSASADAAAQIQDSQQEAVDNANSQINTLAPNTSAIPASVIQDVIQDAGTVADETPSLIWGHDFFRNGAIDLFDKVPNTKVGDNYIIGEGDQLTVAIWGYAYYNYNFTVNEDGYITTLEVGRIYLKGLTFSAAKQLLRQRFASAFDLTNSKFDVSITYSKSIKVNIVGEVVNPGSYNISSLNTAFNALVAAGGVTEIGSVRNIQVQRNGKVIKTLDVY